MEPTVIQIVTVGVLVFVLSQIFLRWFIEPVRQLKKTMSDILHSFLRYTYVMHYVDVIPPDLHSEAFEELRRLSDQLYTDMTMIPKCLFNYSFFGKILSLPEEEMVYKSAQNLVATANWMNVKHENKLIHIISNIQNACDNLGLYIDPNDRITDKHLNV
jgi:hypothetical protein